jgi:hypothetical protein
VLTGGLVVDEGPAWLPGIGWHAEAASDGEEEVRRDGDAGEEVLIYERLLFQLLVLRRRERPPPAHRVLRRRVLPDPAHTNKSKRERSPLLDRCACSCTEIEKEAGSSFAYGGGRAAYAERGEARQKGSSAEDGEVRWSAAGDREAKGIAIYAWRSLSFFALLLPAVPLLMCGAFAFYLGCLALSLSVPLAAGCAGAVLCCCCVRAAGGGGQGWLAGCGVVEDGQEAGARGCVV